MSTMTLAVETVKAETTLLIKGIPYGVAVLNPEDPDVMGAVIVTHSLTGDAYVVGCSRSNGPTCECGDYEFRRGPAGQICKHIGAALEAGLLNADVALDDEGRVVGVRKVSAPSFHRIQPARVPATVIGAERSRLSDRMTYDPGRGDWVPAEVVVGELERALAELVPVADPVVASTPPRPHFPIPSGRPKGARRFGEGLLDDEPETAKGVRTAHSLPESEVANPRASWDAWTDESCLDVLDPADDVPANASTTSAPRPMGRDEPPALTLAEVVEVQAKAFRAWGNSAGLMLASHVEELVNAIRYCDAQTVLQFRRALKARDFWHDAQYAFAESGAWLAEPLSGEPA